jgi:single-stranded DNA-binding protein
MTISGIETAFIANVGSEPELKTSAAGKIWAAFSACVGDGEDAQWLRVAVFGDRAQQLAGHLHKGDKIYAEGRLKLDTWTGKDGQQRNLKVAAWRVEQLGQIGKNKPANPKAPPEGKWSAASIANSDNRVPLRDWQRPADEVIPCAPEFR